MSDYKLEICPHPSQAINPLNGKPLTKKGVPVPLFPDQYSIRLDGSIIAYVLSDYRIAFLVPSIPAVILEDSKALVEKKFGKVGVVTAPPAPPIQEEE